ncbi:MAG: gamma-glutamyl-gamma-aminobutyrate hydrolase family protein [Oscillospiraceae bacterium]|nr:gamma-glutamyl-gamma-aminobutyrate hydrolase family protein [Oscillospiraceae bacterium]
MKPIIGIFPSFDEEKKQIFLNQAYFDAVIESGGIPFSIPLSENPEIISETIKNIDGIIFSGGTDINPKYYNEENFGKSLGICDFLDECERKTVALAVEADIPVLGICRGMQALNVFCGGSMIQDIPSEYDTKIIHRLDKPEIAFHKILVEKSSPLSEIMGFGEHLINSYHHQAVKEVAPDFSVCATAEDGIIEAIYHKNKKFILGVQWHPERDQETATENKKIIDSFVKICSK